MVTSQPPSIRQLLELLPEQKGVDGVRLLRSFRSDYKLQSMVSWEARGAHIGGESSRRVCGRADAA